MLAFLNGKFVPEEQGAVSIFDRSFCLGDGLFEAQPVHNGKLFLWNKHFERLRAGAEFLKIKLPFSADAIHSFAVELFAKNQAKDGMLRIQLSRGVGARGYSTKGANSPTLVMTLHPFRKISSSCKVVTSSIRIPANDPLSKFKTCSKLSHIFARTEADECNADEALLLNADGNIAEATSSNFFWIEHETVCTPPFNSGALPGVTRELVLEICRESKIPAVEKNITTESLPRVEAAFLTSSGVGVREISHIDGRELSRSTMTQRLRDTYFSYAESAN